MVRLKTLNSVCERNKLLDYLSVSVVYVMAAAEVGGDICYQAKVAGFHLGKGEHDSAARAAVHSLYRDQEPREVRAGHLDVALVAGIEIICRVELSTER